MDMFLKFRSFLRLMAMVCKALYHGCYVGIDATDGR